MRWINYIMVYLGSILMIYNIYGFIRFARYIRELKSWNNESRILDIPIVLLVCFLLGYVAVGFFGKPDTIVASILFGGSVFVFAMYKLLSSVTQRIVESEHLEAELLAAEESNRAKTNFLASMSHEMRTPMNAIIGLDEIALQDESLKPQTRERLDKIEISARHLLDIINDVLDMSHIESNDIQLKEEPFSPLEIVDLVSVLTQAQCDEKGLEFRKEIPGELPRTCVGDSLRLRQILLSILGNAVKFTPEGGTVRFVAEQVSADTRDCALRFTISDTGIGIDENYIPRIYDSFSKEDSSTTNRYGGSGLGLSITKKLVDLMKGDIAVTSEKGKGTTFVVTAGFAIGETDEAAAPEVVEVDRSSIRGKRILIVEDIDLNAELIADLLEMEDVLSERAENGQVAVDMFSDRAPGYYDAILMDLRMPVMDGLAATRAIRALDRPDAKAIPIVALTANAFEEDVRQSLEAGMNVHLSKPADSDLLFETLCRLVPQ